MSLTVTFKTPVAPPTPPTFQHSVVVDVTATGGALNPASVTGVLQIIDPGSGQPVGNPINQTSSVSDGGAGATVTFAVPALTAGNAYNLLVTARLAPTGGNPAQNGSNVTEAEYT
jgi:hypothetical protein